MESQKEDEILLDYDWDSDIDGPINGYPTSYGQLNHSNLLSNGPVSMGNAQPTTTHRAIDCDFNLRR